MALIGYAASFGFSCSSCGGEQTFIYYRKYCMHALAAIAAAVRRAASGEPEADACLSVCVSVCYFFWACVSCAIMHHQF
jgi:hypothetical protein